MNFFLSLIFILTLGPFGGQKAWSKVLSSAPSPGLPLVSQSPQPPFPSQGKGGLKQQGGSKNKAPPAPKKDDVLEELKLLTEEGIETLSTPSPNPLPLSRGRGLTEEGLKEEEKGGLKQEAPSAPPLGKGEGVGGGSKNKAPPKGRAAALEKILAQRSSQYDPAPKNSEKKKLAKKLQSLIEKHPRFKEAYWALFDLIHHYNEWAKGTDFLDEGSALQALELIKDIRQKFGESPKTLRFYCHYLSIGLFESEAKTACLKLKNLQPQNPEGWLYSDYFFSDKKEKNLLKILKKFPDSERVLLETAQMFFEKKAYPLSLKYFKKTLKKNPDLVPALIGAAQALSQMDQPSGALSYFSKACKKNKLKAKTPFQKAKARLSQQSLFREALKYQNHINFCLQ